MKQRPLIESDSVAGHRPEMLVFDQVATFQTASAAPWAVATTIRALEGNTGRSSLRRLISGPEESLNDTIGACIMQDGISRGES